MHARWYRLTESIALLIALGGACGFYLVRGARGDTALNVVAFLDDIGPVWPVLLGVGALSVLIGILVRGAAVAGHSIAVGVLLAYSAALWWGVAAGSNGWVTASFALALAIHASVLTNVYGRSPQWTRH